MANLHNQRGLTATCSPAQQRSRTTARSGAGAVAAPSRVAASIFRVALAADIILGGLILAFAMVNGQGSALVFGWWQRETHLFDSSTRHDRVAGQHQQRRLRGVKGAYIHSVANRMFPFVDKAPAPGGQALLQANAILLCCLWL